MIKTQQVRRGLKRKGFALPTVLIASIVLLTVLAVSVSATTAVRTTLKNQYYAQLAQVAGEAGVAYAKACLAGNGNVPQWTDAKPLTPATDCSGNPIASALSVQSLVVAGGGSGGSSGTGNGGAGGGGAGGLLYNPTYTTLSIGTPVTVTVGNGGAAVVGTSLNGNNGANSVFGSMTAIGGGAGGRASPGSSGSVGGSGGGGGFYGYGTNVMGSAGTAGQGNSGGASLRNNNGGGGGGAGGAGGSTDPAYVGVSGGVGGAGGVGLSYSIGGASVTYARGGEGGAWPSGSLQNGAANTGNGGSASAYSLATTSGSGGSGIVIVRYPTSSMTATGGTITYSGSDTIHTFTSSGTFTPTALGGYNCATDSRCFVTVNGNVRSSFTVGAPTLDASGKAVTLPNNGYVEITRTSNGSVWRRYNQPSVQAAVVADLCTTATNSSQGWGNAVRASTQDALPLTGFAQSITLADTTLNAGPMFFRKDFTVTEAGSYKLQGLIPLGQPDTAEFYIDGVYKAASSTALAGATFDLSVGCHNIMVRLTNATIAPKASRFTAAVQRADGAVAPVAATDASWRVTAGNTVHYSSPNYYSQKTLWAAPRVFGMWNDASMPWGAAFSAWATTSGDSGGNLIGTVNSASGNNYPGNSYAWFRSTQNFTVGSDTQTRVTFNCDDNCAVYLDGNLVSSPPAGSGMVSILLTIPAGTHTFGVRLYNSATANVSALLFAAVRTSDGFVLQRSDAGWETSNFWSTTASDYYSYDANFSPFPNPLTSVSARVLAVGGGGGGGSNHGGGGGGGGVVYNSSLTLDTKPYTVTVGAGGAGGVGLSGTGGTGGVSVFGTVVAFGGGGGGSRGNTNNVISKAVNGGSGGGGAGTLDGSTGRAGLGNAGVIGQGTFGGNGSSDGTAGNGGGGGGAGVAGGNSTGAGGVNVGSSGAGGNGVTNSISGASLYYGGGGAGGRWGAGTVGAAGLGGGGVALGIAGAGAVGGAGTANTGGGGAGGGEGVANAGAGGSGIVIISYVTGTMTATGGTVTTSGGYTIHTFKSSGTFTPSAIVVPVELLTVAGGGGGGSGAPSAANGGGGGGGGVVYDSNYLVTVGSYTVSVGPGGAANTNGSNSAFGGVTATGGGKGGGGAALIAGAAGGSGGGGSSSTSGAASGGLGLAGQGTNGASSVAGSPYRGGGGGGASEAGGVDGAGYGGDGFASSISGSMLYYGGGGGAGADSGAGLGGDGGGGNGVVYNGGIPGVAGGINTGGGGGGGASQGVTIPGGAGGSGIVIVSYSTGSMTATGGVITTSGGRTIHTFTSSGTFRVVSIP